MQARTSKVILINPEELVFSDVVVGSTYVKTLTIKNNINANVDLVF